MNSRKWLAALALVPFVFAACQPDVTEVVAGGGREPTPTTSPPAGTAAPDGLLVRVDQGVGAFTLPEVAFRQIPTFLLTTDGEQIDPGAQILIYPGPLLLGLQATPLTDAQVAAVMALADEHGIVGDFTDTTLTTFIADVGSTVVRVQRNGVLSTWEVYGLGMATGQLPPEVAAKHAALGAFIEDLTTRFPPAFPPDPHNPDEYAVGQLPVDPGGFDSDVAPTVRPWPVSFGDEDARCQVVDGDVVRAELSAASQLTFFERSDGSTVQVLLRPLLPGSDACD